MRVREKTHIGLFFAELSTHLKVPIAMLAQTTAASVPPQTAEKWQEKYAELQAKLLSLSANSKQLVAEHSGHFVIIDRPDVVIDAISEVVQAVRNNTKL